MFIKSYLLAGSLAATCLGNPLIARQGFCGTPELSEEERNESRLQIANADVGELMVAGATTTVPTYVHVVAKSNTLEGGYLTRDTILAQMEQLNIDFTGTGFNFSLTDIDWTVNAKWDVSGNWIFNGNQTAKKDDMEMRKKLRKGGYGSLNLYVHGSFEGGYCTFPRNIAVGSTGFYADGCYISRLTVPGGSSDTFSQGKVASHEVGHWLYLYHTFQDGCDGAGDEVADTPAEALKQGAQGCPVGSDTCPTLPGLDPIHNHMTYTADTCRNEFTSGQISRMLAAWSTYRAGK